MAVAKQQIVDDLRALGVRPGVAVMMHSSLSALGPVEGGAETVVDALLEVVGPDGALLVPAFRDSVWGDPSEFTNSDCECTPADGLCPSQQPGFQGIIPETVRRRPGSLRSCHPTHSWVGLGGPARRLLEAHFRSPTPCGPGNPLELMTDDDCVLTLGVMVDRVTLWHYYEERQHVPYAGHYWPEERHLNHTVLGLRLQYQFPGILQDVCRAAGILTTGPVGKGTSGLMAVGEFRRFMATVIADDPHCMVLRPPDRDSGDLAVDALRKAEAMLRAWRRGPAEPSDRFDRPPRRVEPAGAGDVVREDCPAFAGYHDADGRSVPLCKANGRHPGFFRIGGAFDDYGLTTCGQCSWHRRFPR
jgi:aminoglycoside N3'-acetyltransferase